jgi:hypothetical protein
MKHPSSIIRVPINREAFKPEKVPILESPLKWVPEEKVGPSQKGWFTGLLTAMLHLTMWSIGLLGVGTLVDYALHGRW